MINQGAASVGWIKDRITNNCIRVLSEGFTYKRDGALKGGETLREMSLNS